MTGSAGGGWATGLGSWLVVVAVRLLVALRALLSFAVLLAQAKG